MITEHSRIHYSKLEKIQKSSLLPIRQQIKLSLLKKSSLIVTVPLFPSNLKINQFLKSFQKHFSLAINFSFEELISVYEVKDVR
jgi:antibiotic biosynthesis monooxygenase (ABM) superfamily enzyme